MSTQIKKVTIQTIEGQERARVFTTYKTNDREYSGFSVHENFEAAKAKALKMINTFNPHFKSSTNKFEHKHFK